MQIPGLTKIVVNMGVGGGRDSKVIDGAVRGRLAQITGQKPQVTKARKSIAQFKLREGMPIAPTSTLRGDRMWSSSTGCSPWRCPGSVTSAACPGPAFGNRATTPSA